MSILKNASAMVRGLTARWRSRRAPFSKMGFVLFTITTAICGMTGWDKYHVIVGVGMVTILYTLVGGLEAVIWTEVLQGIVKIIGVFVVLGVLISIMPGGAGAAFQLASEKHKMNLGSFDFDLTANGNFWVMLLYGAENKVD